MKEFKTNLYLSKTTFIYRIASRSKLQEGLAIRGFAIYGFDYSQRIWVEPNPLFI